MFPSFHHQSLFQKTQEVKLYDGSSDTWYKNGYKYKNINLINLNDIHTLLHASDHFFNAFNVLYNGESCMVKEQDEHRTLMFKEKPKHGWKKSVKWIRYVSHILNIILETYESMESNQIISAIATTRMLLDAKDENNIILEKHLSDSSKFGLETISNIFRHKNALPNIFGDSIATTIHGKNEIKMIRGNEEEWELFKIKDTRENLIKHFLSEIMHTQIPLPIQMNSIHSIHAHNREHFKIITGFVLIEVLTFIISKTDEFFRKCIDKVSFSPSVPATISVLNTYYILIKVSSMIRKDYTKNVENYTELLKEPCRLLGNIDLQEILNE